MPEDEDAPPPDDESSEGRLRAIGRGIIGFMRGFSFGRHLNRRYD